MINEKALCAAMKAAWRGGGYEVVAYGEQNRIWINGAQWGVEMKKSEAPRKVLALLVEHLGEIPCGSAWAVSKAGGAQQMVVDMMLTRIDSLKNVLMREDEVEIKRTAMMWKGLEVWQKENLEVLTYDGAMVCIGVNDPVSCGGNLVWEDGGLVVVMPEEAMEPALRELLEQTVLA